MRLQLLAVLLSLILLSDGEEQKASLSQRIARWLWSPGSQQGHGPSHERGNVHTGPGQDNCLPCNKIPWVPVARALGHVPATYQSQGSKYTFHLPTIGIVPLRQLSNSYGPPKPEYGPPPIKQEYGPPPIKQEYGPPPIKQQYGPPPIKQEYGPPPIKQEYAPPLIKQEYGPPLIKQEYGPPPIKQEYGPPPIKQEYGPPPIKQEYGPPPIKQEYGPPPPKIEYGPPPPKQEFGPPPNQEYGPPKLNFIPPKLEIPPKQEFGPPANLIKQEFLPPDLKPPGLSFDQPKVANNAQLHFIAPKPDYGLPLPDLKPLKSVYGAPNVEYGPPKQELPPHKPIYGPPKPEYGPPKPEYGPPKPQFGQSPPPIKFSYAPNHPKGSYRAPSARFQGTPLTLLTPPKLPFQLQNPSGHQSPPEAMSYQSFHQYLTPPHSPNGPNGNHEHTIIHSQNHGPFNVHPNNAPPMIFTISEQSQSCNKCPSGPNLGPEPHTAGIEDATKEVGNFGDLPLSDSAHEASSSVTASHASLPITEVSVTKSLPISEYISSIEFPVQIIQAPLLDIPELPKYVNLGYDPVHHLKGQYQHENIIRNLRDEGGKIPDSDNASSTKQSSLSNANSLQANHKSEGDVKGYGPTTPQPSGYHYYTISEESHPIYGDTTPFFPSTYSPPFFSPSESPTETNAHGPMQHFDIYNSTYLDEQIDKDIRLMDGPSRQPPHQKTLSWTTVASSQARPFSTQPSQIDQIFIPYATLQKVDLPVNGQARKVPNDPLRQPDLQAMMVNRGFSGTEFHIPTGTEQLEPVDLPRLIDTLPPDVANRLRELVEKHGESELRHIIAENLQDLLRKEEDSVDIVRLQKNIDNWTAEGFRRAFTNLPQFDSKKIPEEYLTTSMPEYEASGSHLDPVTKKNGTDYIKVIKGWALVETKVMTTTEVTPERQPWEKLEVSISPLTKEKVYVVTPLNTKHHPTTIPPDLPNRITRESAKSTKGTEATTTPLSTVSTTTVRSPRNADNLIDGVTASVRYLGRNGR